MASWTQVFSAVAAQDFHGSIDENRMHNPIMSASDTRHFKRLHMAAPRDMIIAPATPHFCF